METLWRDLRHSARVLWKSPAFTIVAVVTLALGIGANTAVFTLVRGLLLRPLPYHEPQRLVRVWESSPSRGIPDLMVAPVNYQFWKEHNRVFEEMAAFTWRNVSLTGIERPERLWAVATTTSLFPLLGRQALIGRVFLAHEEQFGSHRVVVLGYRLWQGRFGGDRSLVGRSILLDQESHLVAGVLGPDFEFVGRDVDLWVPLSFAPRDPQYSTVNHSLTALARLRPGVELPRARMDMRAVMARLREQHKENAGLDVALDDLHHDLVGAVEPALLVLLGAVAFVLLIACGNLANLLLARAAAREREIAVRLSLGAGRADLLRQFFTESLVLSLLGGSLGLLVARWSWSGLRWLGPLDLPRLSQVRVDALVLWFTLGLALVTAVLFGLAPAWRATRPELSQALKEAGRGFTGGVADRRLRALLVVSETALSLLLLTGAGLMLRSFLKLREVPLGVSADQVLLLRVDLPANRYRETARAEAFWDELLARVRGMPGMIAAGFTSTVPLSGNEWGKMISFEDRPAASRLQEVPVVQYFQISDEYLSVMSIAVRKGRAFNDQDRRGSPVVALINETAARRFWHNQDPLGKLIWMGPPEALARHRLPPGFRYPRLEVVGIVADVRASTPRQSARPQVFAVNRQSLELSRRGYVVMRSSADPGATNAALRRLVAAMDPELPLEEAFAMDRFLSRAFSRPRFQAVLLSAFAALALLLASAGIFGVVSYTVAQRTREVGLRLALGAGKRDLILLLLGQAMRPVAAGLLLGLAAALALPRLLAGMLGDMLFEVSASDPMVLSSVAGLLVAVALLAAYLPARRALRVEPVIALRHE